MADKPTTERIVPPATLQRGDTVEAITALAQAAERVAIGDAVLPGNIADLGLPTQIPILIDRKAQQARTLKPLFEEWRTAPRERTGDAVVETLESFIALVNRHKDADSAVFAQTTWPEPALTAVIDYHRTDGTARFGRHRILYRFPVTDELKAWLDHDDEQMPQLAFAAFLEEHAAELAAPLDGERSEFELLFKERFATPAELIELSRDLEVHVGAKVKRQERLASGERAVVFESEHRDAKGGKIDIPGLFMVSVPAFLDGEPVRIPARLRYRLKEGEIVWLYQLYRGEFWLHTRVQTDIATVRDATSLPVYEGTPEA